METTFSSLSVHPSLSRSARTNGDFTSSRSKSEEDIRIEEGITLLVRREPNGKTIFNDKLVMNLVIILLSILRERKIIRGISNLEDLEMVYIQMNMMSLKKEF